jgi:ElaB/YqjD/DUF883 family membrane-anchored ribosome-binding protein
METYYNDIKDRATQAEGERANATPGELSQTLNLASEMCTELQERFKTGVQMTDETVRLHPYYSLGVAFTAGLVIGALLQRR